MEKWQACASQIRVGQGVKYLGGLDSLVNSRLEGGAAHGRVRHGHL
jgi:hypothetical protein